MSPKNTVKFQKRKSQEEGGTNEKSEEPHESPKRVKQEHCEKEPAHQEPGNCQGTNPMEEVPLHPKNQDKVRDPEEEDVIEVKYVGADKSRKRTYSNIQDRVEKKHNEKCRRLSDHLQPCDPVHSDPPSTHTRPADNLKNIKGCMEEHIHGCETTQFQPNQSRHPVRRHHSPVTTEKSYSPQTHFESQKTVGLNFENQRTRHHPQPDILGGPKLQK
ncbi:Sentrin-specific protease 2 [Cricetulus griseus]|uniref:Sentrin-specific protease 2 n=1 Tax=Cricetulus griseus TaxID=10029 RepID=G3I7Y1_CRIGR|nr:Sentrin-specific protease 2 [Cricetulus griseus]